MTDCNAKLRQRRTTRKVKLFVKTIPIKHKIEIIRDVSTNSFFLRKVLRQAPAITPNTADK